jgi:hypothetical protein
MRKIRIFLLAIAVFISARHAVAASYSIMVDGNGMIVAPSWLATNLVNVKIALYDTNGAAISAANPLQTQSVPGSTLLTPTAATVSIDAANTSYQLAVTNQIRMLHVQNTNGANVYLMSATNSPLFWTLTSGGEPTQWTPPNGMVTAGTTFWVRCGATGTGLVHFVYWK